VVAPGDPDPGAPANGTACNLTADLFVPHRISLSDRTVFTTLCDVFCNPGPSDQTVYANTPATFMFTPDGTPPYTIQWSTNGVPVAGANSAYYTTPPVPLSDNGAVYSVTLYNSFSTNTCSDVLHTRPNPIVISALTLNDPNHIYVTWNKDVNLNGIYTINDLT